MTVETYPDQPAWWAARCAASVAPAYAIGASSVAAILGKSLASLLRWKATLRRIIIGFVGGMVGWIGVLVHIKIFDRLFLRLCKVDRLLRER